MIARSTFAWTALAASAFALASPVTAQETASTDAVYSCAEIEDIEERLACYDEAVGRLQEAEDAGEIATVTREEVEEAERESFGFSLPSLPSLSLPSFGGGDDEPLQNITANVEEVDETLRGKLLITLDNGQLWEQTDGATITRYYRRAEQATVSRGALGSFWMELGDSQRFRVKRLN